VDPHHLDANPYHPDADSDSDYYLMLMKRIRIRIFNLVRIQIPASNKGSN
jgi:hypothetical protein